MVKTLLPLQGAHIQLLAEELRSHGPCSIVKNKNKKVIIKFCEAQMVKSLDCNGSSWILEGCWNVIRVVTTLEIYRIIEEPPRLYLGTRDHFICLNFVVHISVGGYRDNWKQKALNHAFKTL